MVFFSYNMWRLQLHLVEDTTIYQHWASFKMLTIRLHD